MFFGIYQALISRVMVVHHLSVTTVTLCALLANRSKNLCLLCYELGCLFFVAVLEPYLSSTSIWTSLCCRVRTQTCSLSLNMLNTHCFSASFTLLNPPGLLSQREVTDDGREFIPYPRSSEWALSLHYDVFAGKKVSVLLHHHAKNNFLGVILICLCSTFTCWHDPQVCITYGSFSGLYVELWETSGYWRRRVCWMWGWGGGFPCIFESLILQVITQQCKLHRGSKEPWPLPALAWPCIRPSCLTL